MLNCGTVMNASVFINHNELDTRQAWWNKLALLAQWGTTSQILPEETSWVFVETVSKNIACHSDPLNIFLDLSFISVNKSV